MATIFDIRSDSLILLQGMVEFLDTHHYDGPRPTQDEADQFIFDLLDDLISERMLWCPTSAIFRDRIEERFTWFSWKLRDRHSKTFFKDVIEPTMVDVKRKLSKIITETDYTVWYTRKGLRDLYISRGEDYRIIDWERRMASGEWSKGD